MRALNKKFYSRDTLTVAKDLLGKYIIRKIGNKKIVGRIVEVEAGLIRWWNLDKWKIG